MPRTPEIDIFIPIRIERIDLIVLLESRLYTSKNNFFIHINTASVAQLG